MREAFHHIRKKYIDALNGNVTLNAASVPIYNRVPSDASTPFIRIYSYEGNEIDQNNTSYTTELITKIECVTSFQGDDGGEYELNLVVDQVLDIIRTRTNEDLSAEGFNVYTTTMDRVRYLEDYEEFDTYFRAIIEISNRVQKT